MKRIISLVLLVAIVLGIYFVLTPKDNISQIKYADGNYEYLSDTAYNGYFTSVKVKVEKNEIKSIFIDDIDENGDSKREKSKSGDYDMAPDQIAPWHTQVDNLSNAIIFSQSTNTLGLTDTGTVDAVSSCTINVSNYISIINDLLIIESGFIYNDGSYEEQGQPLDDGSVVTVKLIVKDGNLSSLFIDEISADGVSKRDLVKDGNYDMGSAVSWTGQLDALSSKIIDDNGTKSIVLNDDGKVDAVSSCTISVSEFIPVIEQAINKAK